MVTDLRVRKSSAGRKHVVSLKAVLSDFRACLSRTLDKDGWYHWQAGELIST